MSKNKRVFISLGIFGGAIVGFLLLCGFGLVFVVNTIQEEADSEHAMLRARQRAAQRDVDAKNFDDSPPPTVEKRAVVAPLTGEPDDNPATVPAVTTAQKLDDLSEFIEQAESMAANLWPRIDANGNGKLDAEEIASSRDPASMKKADADKDGEISKAEFITNMAQRMKANAESASQTANTPSSGTTNKSEAQTASTTDPKDPKPPIEPPADDLAEFLEQSEKMVARFWPILDPNDDGILEGEEISPSQTATLGLRNADSDKDGGISKAEFIATVAKRMKASVESFRYTLIGPVGEIIDRGEKFILFSEKVISKYDENKNGLLDGAEVSVAVRKSSMIKPSADVNSNGEINSKELAWTLSQRGGETTTVAEPEADSATDPKDPKSVSATTPVADLNEFMELGEKAAVVWYPRFDLNDDGKIDKDEMFLYAVPTYLLKKDLNNDDIVTEEEYTIFFANRLKKLAEASATELAEFEKGFEANAARTLANRDKNKNGVLDGAEVNFFTYSDLNSDGEITLRELALAGWLCR